jgi:GntR family transcriptional regulator
MPKGAGRRAEEVSDPLLDKLARHPVALISRTSTLPLHLQFRQLLLGMIERGEIHPGEQLPREREIASRYGVSLAPIRQAILDLAKEGYLYRVQGRGTFVREQTVEEKVAILSSFTESMRAKGLEPELHVLRQEAVPTPKAVADGLKTQERKILLIERLASVDGEPVAILAAYLSRRTFPGLRSLPLDGRSLYRTLKERFGTVVARAESVIEVGRCSSTQAALLGLAPGAPVLQVEGTTFDEADRPVEYSTVLYRADRFRFRLDSYRRSDQVIHLIDGSGAGAAHG